MRTYWLFALLPVLSACTVGPDYVGPPGISSRFVRIGGYRRHRNASRCPVVGDAG